MKMASKNEAATGSRRSLAANIERGPALSTAMYPVDLLEAVNDEDLNAASERHLSLLGSRPCHSNDEWFDTPAGSKVAVTGSNVSSLQLFEDNLPGCAVLALHPPDDHTQVVALYLHDRWWSVEDVLKTSSKSRTGLVQVRSAVERVLLFLLCQVVGKLREDEPLFLPHPRMEQGKLLWRYQQAVGFYTFKQKGSLCGGWSGQSYQLPVLDTVLVRRGQRGRGLGLQMLLDFCSSFPGEEALGVSSPLSHGMVEACRSFLRQHEEQRERLYEVEAPGGWAQRRNIWLSIQLGRYSHSAKDERCPRSAAIKGKDSRDLSHTRRDDGPRMATVENTCGSSGCDSRQTGSDEPHDPGPGSSLSKKKKRVHEKGMWLGGTQHMSARGSVPDDAERPRRTAGLPENPNPRTSQNPHDPSLQEGSGENSTWHRAEEVPASAEHLRRALR